MDKEINFGMISIILALIAILLSWRVDLLTVVGSVVIGSISIAFAYLSSYVKQVKENTGRINNLEKDYNVSKRLIKIEDDINNIKRKVKL